jgi:hypothetical protein
MEENLCWFNQNIILGRSQVRNFKKFDDTTDITGSTLSTNCPPSGFMVWDSFALRNHYHKDGQR